MSPRTSHPGRILLLNEWIPSLGVELRLAAEDNRPALCLLLKSCGACSAPDASVPVTTDMRVALELLGFDDPDGVVEQADTLALERSFHPFLCKSRLFTPSLMRTGGKSSTPFMQFVRGAYPPSAGAEVRRDAERLAVELRAVIEARFPRVRAEARDIEARGAVLDAVRSATLGEEPAHSAIGQRWREFIKLHGLLPLRRLAPCEARAAWTAFRDNDE